MRRQAGEFDLLYNPENGGSFLVRNIDRTIKRFVPEDKVLFLPNPLQRGILVNVSHSGPTNLRCVARTQ
jgi:hypothetical protein